MKTIYTFEKGFAEGSKADLNLLGGKGANLAEMCKMGLPVPDGFTIPTTACIDYLGHEGSDFDQKALVLDVASDAMLQLISIQEKYGYEKLPLFSVRSGARVSMPGMMDTILNVGMTFDSLPYWQNQLGVETANDCFRRFIQMYGNVVYGIPNEIFEDVLAESDTTKEAIFAFSEIYDALGVEFPDTVNSQLNGAIAAVFKSWNSERAISYRKAHKIPNDWGTAVNIQMMVFGNAGETSGSGVLFSRDPDNGDDVFYGDWLPNAQGEDVVAGIRDTLKVDQLVKWNSGAAEELFTISKKLEAHYNDMQDIEFTVQDGKVFFLQTRNGHRSAQAAFKIAYDMVAEGTLTQAEALQRVSGKQYMVFQKPSIDPSFTTKPNFQGMPAAGSLASGIAVFSAQQAEQTKGSCILVSKETTPEDFSGMLASVGILTTTGGATSHAAVVARGMDKVCVVGATNLKIGTDIKPGDFVTIDGATGRIWINTKVPVSKAQMAAHVEEMLDWAMDGKAKSSLLKKSLKVGPDFRYWKEEILSQLPEAGNLFLDLTSLPKGKKDAKRALRNVIEALKKRPNLSGVLGLSPSERRATRSEDVKFLEALGLNADTPAGSSATSSDFNSHMKALLTGPYITKKFKSRWVVSLPEVASAEDKAELQANDWPLVVTVSTLADLLSAEAGMIQPSKELNGLLKAEGVTFADFLSTLQQAGKKVSTMPEIVSWERLVFEVLG